MGKRLGDAPWSRDGRVDEAWFSSQHPQSGLPLGTVPTCCILLRRDRFHMVRVDAGTIPAEVVHHQAGGDRSSVHLVVVAMGGNLLAITALQGITLKAEIALPDPAARTRIDPVVDWGEVFDELPWVCLTGSRDPCPTRALRLTVSSALALPARGASTHPNGVGLIERVCSNTVGLGLPTSGDRVPS